MRPGQWVWVWIWLLRLGPLESGGDEEGWGWGQCRHRPPHPGPRPQRLGGHASALLFVLHTSIPSSLPSTGLLLEGSANP